MIFGLSLHSLVLLFVELHLRENMNFHVFILAVLSGYVMRVQASMSMANKDVGALNQVCLCRLY
jgi:hypothetical protein